MATNFTKQLNINGHTYDLSQNDYTDADKSKVSQASIIEFSGTPAVGATELGNIAVTDSTGAVENWKVSAASMTFEDITPATYTGVLKAIRAGSDVWKVDTQGGGGGGTSYADLEGKPQIGGVTLASGNNTIAALGLQAALTAGTGITLSGSTISATTNSSKSAVSGGTELSLVTTGEKYTWNSKQNALTASTGITLSGSTISVNTSVIQAKLPTTTTAGKVLKSTTTAGTVVWGDATGGITGPTSSTVGHVAVWNDTTGTKLKDIGTITTAAECIAANDEKFVTVAALRDVVGDILAQLQLI